jgi:WD40 repeat protein/tetratricopeptide (TPR) repeat protein
VQKRHFLNPWGWLYLFDVATGQRIGQALPLSPFTDTFHLAKARDGRTIALLFRAPRDQQGRVEFRDVGNDRLLPSLPDLVPALTLQPDGHTLLSAAPDGTVLWWDSKGHPLREPWRPHQCRRAEGLTADGTTMVARGHDGRVYCYSLATGHVCKALIPLTPHEEREPLSISPDGTAILIPCPDTKQTQLWHFANPRLTFFAGPAPLLGLTAATPTRLVFDAVAYSPDRQRLLLGGQGTDVDRLGERYGRLMETATNRPQGKPLRGATSGVDGQPGPDPFTRGHTFSPNGKLAATCTHAGMDLDVRVRVWDTATGRSVTAPLPVPKLIHSLVFSPDSRLLAAGTVGPIFLWDVTQGEQKVLPQVGPVHLLRFSPDGRYLAGARRSGWGDKAQLQFWDLEHSRPVAPPVALPETVTDMMFLEDGRTLLTLEVDANRVGRWDAASGQRAAPDVHLEAVPGVRIGILAPNGRRFTTSSRGGGIQQWDTATGQRVGPAMIHPSVVLFVVYSPDGATLAVAYADGTVRLWDADTSLPFGPALPHRLRLLGMAFTPDSRALLTTTVDGETQTWPLPSPVPEEVPLLEAWLGALTGIRVESNEVFMLDPKDWQEKRHELQAKWPAGEPPGGPPGGLVAWHDTCVRDATQTGTRPVALWHLTRLIALQPKAWLHYARRASVYVDAGDLEAAAADYDHAAVDGGRELLDWYRHRALMFIRLDQLEKARWYLDRLLVVEKEDWRIYADRTAVNQRLGKTKASDADLALMLKHGADPEYLSRLADEYAEQKQWRQTLELCLHADPPGKVSLDNSLRQGLVYRKLGDEANYRRVCRTATQVLRGGRLSAEAFINLCWLCSSGPKALPDAAPLASVLENVLEKVPASDATIRAAFASMLGALHYRAGHYEQAVRWLNESSPSQPSQKAVRDWLFLAMTQQRLGNVREARQWLKKAREHRPDKDSGVWLRVEEELLRREAEAMLNES